MFEDCATLVELPDDIEESKGGDTGLYDSGWWWCDRQAPTAIDDDVECRPVLHERACPFTVSNGTTGFLPGYVSVPVNGSNDMLHVNASVFAAVLHFVRRTISVRDLAFMARQKGTSRAALVQLVMSYQWSPLGVRHTCLQDIMRTVPDDGSVVHVHDGILRDSLTCTALYPILYWSKTMVNAAIKITRDRSIDLYTRTVFTEGMQALREYLLHLSSVASSDASALSDARALMRKRDRDRRRNERKRLRKMERAGLTVDDTAPTLLGRCGGGIVKR